jgi:hypothetical protein
VQQNLRAFLGSCKCWPQLHCPRLNPALMLTIKVEMHPDREAALRSKVAKHGGPINNYLLPYLNAIADGTLTMVPELTPPAPAK